MPKRYPAESRRKVPDLVAAGRQVAQVAADLAISEQTIYRWRRTGRGYQLGSDRFSSRHIRSDGSRQACGAIN